MDEQNQRPADPAETVETVGTESDLDFAVTPLAPSSRTPQAPSNMPWSTRRGRTLLVVAVVIISLVVLLGSYPLTRNALIGWAFPWPSTPVAQVRMPTMPPTPVPTFAPLGSVPDNCPPGNGLETFSSYIGQGVAVSGVRVWLVGFTGPQATARYSADTPLTTHGWPYKLLLVAAPEITQPITLAAQGMFGISGAIWFSLGDIAQATPELTTDPQKLSTVPDGFKWLPFSIYLPSSGCYFLKITTGSTTVGTYFAAGV